MYRNISPFINLPKSHGLYASNVCDACQYGSGIWFVIHVSWMDLCNAVSLRAAFIMRAFLLALEVHKGTN